MKRRHLFLAIAALLAAGGFWLARSAWRSHALHKSSMGVGFETPHGPPKPGQMPHYPNPNRRFEGQMPRPPNPNRLFENFTPEQRVQFARQGHGPGG